MKNILFVCLLMTSTSFAACLDHQRVFGIADLEKKSWETTRVETELEEVCGALFETSDANILIEIVKGTQKFSVRVHRPLVAHFDNLKNGKLTGGRYPVKLVAIDTLTPLWSKDSQITLKEISTGKILAKGKL